MPGSCLIISGRAPPSHYHGSVALLWPEAPRVIRSNLKNLYVESEIPMAIAPKHLCLLLALLLSALLSQSLPSARASDNLSGHKHGHTPHMKAATTPPPDVIVFTNGDQLTGTLLREVGGKVTFHSQILGDIEVPWDKIKSIRTKTEMAILNKTVTPLRGKVPHNLPQGTLTVSDNLIAVHPPNHAMIKPIPVKDARYIIDRTTLNKQIFGHPGIFVGWSGSLTTGATIVQATQKQFTYATAISVERVIPTVTWLNPSDRTTIEFSSSYGRITEAAYTSEGVFYPATDTKSSIYHAGAEQDKYFSPRMYALGQVAFDHNYGQSLDLQQIYGAGIGYTLLKRGKQQLEVKATIQYEGQAFINASSGVNQNLIGSTFAGVYTLKLPHGIAFKQQASYIRAYNNRAAYSANESNTLAIPFYKHLSFSVGTIDSYLNNPPPALPPTMRNSFQFTTGITYNFKSSY
jgi:Protein of unknown function, DUF481